MAPAVQSGTLSSLFLHRSLEFHCTTFDFAVGRVSQADERYSKNDKKDKLPPWILQVCMAVQKGTRVLISLWDSLMFGRVPGCQWDSGAGTGVIPLLVDSLPELLERLEHHLCQFLPVADHSDVDTRPFRLAVFRARVLAVDSPLHRMVFLQRGILRRCGKRHVLVGSPHG